MARWEMGRAMGPINRPGGCIQTTELAFLGSDGKGVAIRFGALFFMGISVICREAQWARAHVHVRLKTWLPLAYACLSGTRASAMPASSRWQAVFKLGLHHKSRSACGGFLCFRWCCDAIASCSWRHARFQYGDILCHCCNVQPPFVAPVVIQLRQRVECLPL